MNHIYLVRHGENHANLTLEFSCRKVDYPLTEKGRLQALQTAEFFRDKGIDEVFTSPLKRAYETAQIIAGRIGLPVTMIEDFREVNVGDLEGQKPTAALWKQHNQIISDWMNGHPEERFPGGENFHELLARTRSGLEQILSEKDGRTILVVGHGGIFSFTLRGLCLPFDLALMEPGMGNCAINELEARQAEDQLEMRLLSFGYREHLSGEAANLVSGVADTSSTDLRQR